jgi:cytochrome c
VSRIDARYPSQHRSLAARIFVAAWLLLAGLTNAGDAKRGGELYVARCGACHSIPENGAGPRHADLIGRRAGTQPGFEYSAALSNSKIIWTPKTLDRWLEDPLAFVPGNKMVVQLANDPLDRADIIAYLLRNAASKQSAPTTRAH